MTTLREPEGLDVGGLALWRGVAADHSLDITQQVQLLEACRAKDRLDQLNVLLSGDVAEWVSDRSLDKANTTANLMKQLLAALRLPDEAGKKPQYRGARGSQAPDVPGGKVSSLDRARARAAGQ